MRLIEILSINFVSQFMIIHKEIETLPQFKNAIITIGSFDGVHKGHLKILDQVLNEADKVNGNAIVITFYPHPKNIIGKSTLSSNLINTFEEKAFLLEKKGITDLIVIPFNKEFADMTAQDFIVNILINKLKPHCIIIGHDHRFGKNRIGDFQMLQEYGKKNNYSVIQIPEHVLENVAISSTAIRHDIINGKIESANELLGYPFFFSGIVVHGKKRGRNIGFPTANIQINQENKLIPGDGVYAVYVTIDGSNNQYQGMMNIGSNPTFEEKTKKIEVNVFNFNDDLYDKKITITMVKRIRDEIKFNGIESLKIQLQQDKEKAITYLT